MLVEKGQHRAHQQKHEWAFQGLITCGHCGCAMVAEKEKGKYIYYHCTGNKGKVDEKNKNEIWFPWLNGFRTILAQAA